MKKIFTTTLILFFCLFGIIAQTATNMTVLDTRGDNTPPSGYVREAKFEFKARDYIGVPGSGYYSGLLTFAPWGDYTGNKVHQLNFNDGGLYWRTGSQNASWETWKRLIFENSNGNVAIGTSDPGDATLKIYKSQWPQFMLADDNTRFLINIARNAWDFSPGSKPGDVVFYNMGLSHNMIFRLNDDNMDGNSYVGFADDGTGNIWMKIANNRTVRIDGKVFATEMNIQPNVWADDVFENGYKLMNLKELELFVQANKHLPGVPSEKEVKQNGVNVSEMNAILLRKVEELSLHIIELNKKIEALEKRK